mmetsp:Transcript_24820/g.42020  ORF Transcript_24820/g.42020 Transcript_24820/m.42020 type:complete len:208 (-) Transcript_24820:596-1219(-)
MKCSLTLDLLHKLYNIFIAEHMIFSTLHRLMFDRTAPHPGVLQLGKNSFVQSVAKVFNGRGRIVQHHRRAIVRNLSLGLGIDSHHASLLPNVLHQFLKIPAVMSRDWYVMGHLINDVKLLYRQLIDLVQHVEGWDIATISFQHINKLINSGITPANDVGTHNAVLFTNGLDHFLRKSSLWHHCLEVDGTFLQSLIHDIRRFLVKADS